MTLSEKLEISALQECFCQSPSVRGLPNDEPRLEPSRILLCGLPDAPGMCRKFLEKNENQKTCGHYQKARRGLHSWGIHHDLE